MRPSVPSPLPAVAVSVLLSACGTTGISGTVHVGPGHEREAVVALLIEVPRDGSGLRAVAQSAVGTAGEDGGAFPYQFHSLASGDYIVGAYLDEDGNRNVSPGEAFEWDPNGTVTIDSIEPERARLVKDLWLAASKPGTGTITGTLFSSERALRWPRVLAAVRRTQDPATLETSIETVRVLDMPAEADAPFALHNIPPGDVQLIAYADVGADVEGSNNLYAIGIPTPVPVGRDTVTRDAQLWLDRQSPALGSLSGTVTFNAAAVNVTLELQAFRNDPYSDPGAVQLGLASLAVPPGATSLSYTLPSMPTGPTYVFATVVTTSGTRELRGTRSWPTIPGIAPQAVPLTAAAPHATGIDFSLGLGRASGTVTIRNAPASLDLVAIATFGAGTQLDHVALFPGVQSTAVDACAGAARCFTTTYELFGLEDRSFVLNLVPDTSGDGWIADELSVPVPRTWTGTPRTVEIVGGGRAACDFTVDW